MTACTPANLRTLLAIGTAATAAIGLAPAALAQDMSYEERVYEYAEPIPTGDPVAVPQPMPQQVEFRSDPIVQPIPAPAPVQRVRYVKQPTYAPAPQPTYVEPVRTREVVYETQQAAPVQHAAPHPVVHATPHHQQVPAYAPPPPAYAPPAFDREEWLDECRDRLGDGDGNGGVIGGLLGAVAGGVIGNRVYDSERLAGTLIGAGVGGLAGLAIGSLIGGSDRDRDLDECEAYLERWEHQQRYGAAYPAPGYAGYATHGYTYVPVTVAVPQRAIVREYVTTEVYTDHEEVIVETTPHHAPAPTPQPTKRQRYIKGK